MQCAISDYMRQMIAPPTFASKQDYVLRIGAVDFWRPYVKRHDLYDTDQQLVAGLNATYPTFIYGEVVVKLFGCTAAWRKAHTFERAALMLVAADPMVAAPRLLGAGRLYEDHPAQWPYLITSRMPGVASSCVTLPSEQRVSIAAELGQQIRHVHKLRPSGIASAADWQTQDIAVAAKQSSLPPRLVAQIHNFLERLEPFDNVFVHGDLCASHVFVVNDHVTRVIDWADAMVTDRHYEIVQLYRDMFGCDKNLLRVFLQASNWPVDRSFPFKALGLALHRQAIGLAQHHSMDVFEPIAARFPLKDIGTLDELAIELFAV